MKVRTRIYLAGAFTVVLFVASQELLKWLGNSYGLPLLVTVLIFWGFYRYAAHFRCAQCGSKLFTWDRMTTPFLPTKCGYCGTEI
jgi:DNA-directed RNA polymerase subunit RPC12/RpoP